MAGETTRRDESTGHLARDEPPEVVAELRVVRGAEGERLAEVQARVLWEVTEWQARNRSASGRENAA